MDFIENVNKNYLTLKVNQLDKLLKGYEKEIKTYQDILNCLFEFKHTSKSTDISFKIKSIVESMRLKFLITQFEAFDIMMTIEKYCLTMGPQCLDQIVKDRKILEKYKSAEKKMLNMKFIKKPIENIYVKRGIKKSEIQLVNDFRTTRGWGNTLHIPEEHLK